MAFISLRRSYTFICIILIIVQLVQTRQLSWQEEIILPFHSGPTKKQDIEAETDDNARRTLDIVDTVIEKVTNILETTEFDVTDEVFNVAQTLNIPYVREARLIFNTLKDVKSRIQSADVFRLIKNSFDYVKDSPLAKSIQKIKSLSTTCTINTNNTQYLAFEELLYTCPPKVISGFEKPRVSNINTKFIYRCQDIKCMTQEILSPITIEFDNGKHLRMTADTYYVLSRKRNFYLMLLQLYETLENNIPNGMQYDSHSFPFSPSNLAYMKGEMVESCLVSWYINKYYKYFLHNNKQPTFAEPNKLELSPTTRYTWFQGDYSTYEGHWRGHEYWNSGKPDFCIADYVHW